MIKNFLIGFMGAAVGICFLLAFVFCGLILIGEKWLLAVIFLVFCIAIGVMYATNYE